VGGLGGEDIAARDVHGIFDRLRAGETGVYFIGIGGVTA
jgi:hypothetical protein